MRSIVALLLLALSSLVAAQPQAGAESHLAVAMDRDHQLFVSTTLDSESVNELSFGLDQAGLQAFRPVDERGLEELVGSMVRLDTDRGEVTIWVDPNARPMAWPAGWRADSDLLDPMAYVVQLLSRAYERAVPAAARTGDFKPMFFLPVPFPPPVPLRVGSH